MRWGAEFQQTAFATNTAPGGPGRQLADLERRHRRRARFQVLDATGTAHLLSVEAGRWWREATYD